VKARAIIGLVGQVGQVGRMRQMGRIGRGENFELGTSCKLAPAGEPLSPEAQKAYDKMLKSKNKRKEDCKK